MENKNKFDSKASIIGGMFLYGIFTLIGVLTFFYLLFLDNTEFTLVIEKYVDSGKGATLKTTAIVNFIYTFLGKEGCLIFLFLGCLLLLSVTIKDVKTLFRYLHKEKLFKMGLVNNMDDDYKPHSLFKSLKNLFNKEINNQRKRKIYSKKELRKMKKEMDNIDKGEQRRN